jgi:FdhD protein
MRGARASAPARPRTAAPPAAEAAEPRGSSAHSGPGGELAAASRSCAGHAYRRDGEGAVRRSLPEELAVAVTVNGSTHAVMMASPADLEDFAVGFALGEGLVSTASEIEAVEILAGESGCEARLWLSVKQAAAVAERRRAMAGPVGCGLCGIESLEAALRPLPAVAGTGLRLAAEDIAGACDALRAHQPLHDLTHAVHAAGFFRPGEGIVLAREDVGRHNALDKLVGALARAGESAAEGAFVMTSRLSVELVQKCAFAGCAVLIAPSAPTAHALRLAEAAGITVVAFARGGGFDCYCGAHRIEGALRGGI